MSMVDVLPPAAGKIAVIGGHGERTFIDAQALDAFNPASHDDYCPTAPPSPRQLGRDCDPIPALRAKSLPGRPRPLAPLPAVKPYVAPPVSSGSIREVMRYRLEEVDLDDCDAHGENAFFVCDLAEVYRQNERWLSAFVKKDRRPITAFFAVKCNPDPAVIRILAQLGLGFDCASHAEIALVLSLGVDPSRIIYANPCKAASFIRYAAQAGVDMMTFDNSDELAKIARYHPRAKLVLRILTDDAGSQCRLGLKFGVPLNDARPLLQRAKALGLQVIGVSFHVGSGCANPALYDDAIQRAKFVFDAAAEVGYDFTLLDIGGGFRIDNLEEIAAVVHQSVEEHFEEARSLKIIAEPGRFYVAEAFELATNIIARRGIEEEELPVAKVEGEEEPPVMYYINDGVYGAFNCTMFDHQVVHPELLTLNGAFVDDPLGPVGARRDTCSIWGPTCDAIDCVTTISRLPVELLTVGDWLNWPNMGAYTICAASQFNGFRQSLVYYTIDDKGVAGIEEQVQRLLIGIYEDVP